MNANLDLIVSATQLLETLGLSPGQPVDHTHLGTAEDLQEQVAYSMQHCAGTERVFSTSSEFQRIVNAAYQLPHTVSKGKYGREGTYYIDEQTRFIFYCSILLEVMQL